MNNRTRSGRRFLILSAAVLGLAGPVEAATESLAAGNVNPSLPQLQLLGNNLGTQQTLGIEGQTLPGVGTFTGFGEHADSELAADLTVPVLNNVGQVTFQAKYSASSNNFDHGIFRWSNGALGLIATLGQSAPGSGTFTSVTTDPSLNDTGTVVFGGSLTGASDGASAGLFTSNGTSLSVAARNLHLANGGGQYSFEGNEAINSGGQVIFYAGIINAGDHASTGIFSSQGFMLARNNNTAPGGGMFINFDQARPVINSNGAVGFIARLNGLGTGVTQGIFTATVSSQTRILHQGQPVFGNGEFGVLQSPLSINSAGQVTFAAQITGATDGALAGIFRGDGSATPITLARSNSSFPNGASVASFVSATANETGQVAFESVDSSSTGLGIYRSDSSSSLVTIASKNTAAPDGQFFVDFNGAHMNAGGTVAFTGYLAATPSTGASGVGIYLGNGTSTLTVIETGQPLAGSTVEWLEPAISENDSGQVVYTAYLTDGRAGNFLFTPALHWVAGAGGNWDTASNWTAGLTPASIHDVYLDPSTPQAITGPVANITVNSLTIGGNAPVALNLSTGNVTVISSFSVAADGSSLNSGKATISLPSFTNLGIVNFSGVTIFNGNVANHGTLTASGFQNWASGSTFTNTTGTATFNSDPGSSGASPLAVTALGGTVNLSGIQHLAGLTISTGGQVVLSGSSIGRIKPVLVTGSLNFGGVTNGWQGQLDLTKFDMVVRNGVFADIANQLKSGFNAHTGYWNGSTGIISSTAATDSRFLTTLGYRQSDGRTFDGVTTTTADVLVKYTYYGDADLSGTVSGADYQQIDMGFGSRLTGWSNGDFNYDGIVNGSDFALIDNTFNQINATGAGALAIVVAAADLAATPSTSSIPEPIPMGLLVIAGICLAVRRRKNVILK